jgi:hypothetical protein
MLSEAEGSLKFKKNNKKLCWKYIEDLAGIIVISEVKNKCL